MRRIHNDKRNYLRMDVDADISFKIRDDDKIHRGKCIDLSHDGIKFETGVKLPTGTILKAVITLENSNVNPLGSSIVVLRIEESQPGRFIVAGKMFDVK